MYKLCLYSDALLLCTPKFNLEISFNFQQISLISLVDSTQGSVKSMFYQFFFLIFAPKLVEINLKQILAVPLLYTVSQACMTVCWNLATSISLWFYYLSLYCIWTLGLSQSFSILFWVWKSNSAPIPCLQKEWQIYHKQPCHHISWLVRGKASPSEAANLMRTLQIK